MFGVDTSNFDQGPTCRCACLIVVHKFSIAIYWMEEYWGHTKAVPYSVVNDLVVAEKPGRSGQNVACG